MATSPLSSYYAQKYAPAYQQPRANRVQPIARAKPKKKGKLTLVQARAQVTQTFAKAGVRPAPGAINRIARELVSGKRTLGKLRSDVAWVKRQLIAGKGTGGHRLVNPSQAKGGKPGGKTGGTGGSGGGVVSGGLPGPSKADLQRSAKMLFPYFPKAVMDTFVKAYVEFGGDAELALAKTRQSSQYAKAFPGLLREDGSLRLGSEGEYLSYVEGYKTRLSTFGVPASLLNTKRVTQLLEGGVDPIEFGQRLDYIYTQVATNLPEIRAAYAREFGISSRSLSLGAIFGSAIDPDINPVELEFRIRRAQVRGEADVHGFNIPISEATRLAEFGLDQQAARNFYSEARTLLPTLGTLVGRHNDPDDDFDLSELTDALVFTDPEQNQRLERLFAQESSLFSPAALFSVRAGALPGLTAD